MNNAHNDNLEWPHDVVLSDVYLLFRDNQGGKITLRLNSRNGI